MPIFKIKVAGKELPIRFDMGAWFAAEKLYNLSHADALKHLIGLSKTDRFRFAVEMGFCMTQTLSEPPSLAEIQRMEIHEITSNAAAIVGAINQALSGGLTAKKSKAAAGSKVAASGTGDKRSTPRRTRQSDRATSGS
jgi:hypothetical protein